MDRRSINPAQPTSPAQPANATKHALPISLDSRLFVVDRGPSRLPPRETESGRNILVRDSAVLTPVNALLTAKRSGNLFILNTSDGPNGVNGFLEGIYVYNDTRRHVW